MDAVPTQSRPDHAPPKSGMLSLTSSALLVAHWESLKAARGESTPAMHLPQEQDAIAALQLHYCVKSEP